MARVLRAQAAHQENRTAMVKRSKLMSTLASIAMSNASSRSARESACATLALLSLDEVNRNAIATPDVLQCLVHNSTYGNERRGGIRETAVVTLIDLALSPPNQPKMAKHSGLVQCLMKFAMNTDDQDLKRRVQDALQTLIAEGF